jgi:hypothetical protein
MKSKIVKYILIGAPLVIGGYLVMKYLKGNKGSSQSNNDGGSNDKFPLQKGSNGDKVKELQNAIMVKNANLLPKFGADGDFGSETEAAVVKLLNKKTVDSQSDITKIKSM